MTQPVVGREIKILESRLGEYRKIEARYNAVRGMSEKELAEIHYRTMENIKSKTHGIIDYNAEFDRLIDFITKQKDAK